MITSVNEFKKYLNESRIETTNLLVTKLNELSALTDDQIVEDSKNAFIKIFGNESDQLKDYADPDFCMRLAREFREDLKFALDNIADFFDFIFPMISSILNDKNKLSAAVTGYANGGDLEDYISESNGDYEFNEEQKEKAYDSYNKGLELYKQGKLEEAEALRQQALKFGSWLDWTDIELPPYTNNKKITVITYGGEEHNYTNADIQEMIDEIDMYMTADNLPKWLFTQHLVKNKEEAINVLKRIIASDKDVVINVQSDAPQNNSINIA